MTEQFSLSQFNDFMQTQATVSADDVVKQMEDSLKTGSGQQEGFYYPKRDADGNASVRLRFFPGAILEGNKMDPRSQAILHHHEFSCPDGKTFKWPCLKTIKERCPVCEHVNEIYKEYGKESEEVSKLCRGSQKSKGRQKTTKIISNVLVEKDDCADPKEKENIVGHVFYMQYGIQLNKIIQAQAAGNKDMDVQGVNYMRMDASGTSFQFIVRKK